MGWTEQDYREFMERRLASEKRARERMQRQPITEAQFQTMTNKAELSQLRAERELDAMDWRRQECGSFEDPLTGEHHPASIAYKIAVQRRKNAPKQPKTPKPRNGYNQSIVVAFFEEYHVPEPQFEYRFDPERKWRFDLVFMPTLQRVRTAIEVQGGLFSGGAHVRPARMLLEFEKWNRGVCLGWRILFVTPQQLLTKQTMDMVRECLGLCPIPDKHIGMAAKL